MLIQAANMIFMQTLTIQIKLTASILYLVTIKNFCKYPLVLCIMPEISHPLNLSIKQSSLIKVHTELAKTTTNLTLGYLTIVNFSIDTIQE